LLSVQVNAEVSEALFELTSINLEVLVAVEAAEQADESSNGERSPLDEGLSDVFKEGSSIIRESLGNLHWFSSLLSLSSEDLPSVFIGDLLVGVFDSSEPLVLSEELLSLV